MPMKEVMGYHWNLLLLGVAILFSTGCHATNVAIGKDATLNSALNYAGFVWTANLTVDGCLLRDDPDNQGCCGASEGEGGTNFITVDLGQSFSVSLIIIYGRYPGGETQLSGFSVYIVSTASGSETLVYDNAGVEYGNGIFNITFQPERQVRAVVIRRPTIMVVCELEVYDFSVTSTVSTQSTMPSNSTAQTGQQGFSGGKSIVGSKSLLAFLTVFVLPRLSLL